MIMFQNGNSYNTIPKSSINIIVYGAGQNYIRVVFNRFAEDGSNEWRDYTFPTAMDAARTYFSISGGQL